MTYTEPIPTPLLEVRVHDLAVRPGLTGLCAGYENKEWRARQLAAHLIEWLPEFALTRKEISNIGSHNLVRVLSRAAQVIYQTPNAPNRGEIGELLLHVAVRQVFNSLPAISKFYFKDSVNSTVKGFDAVHVVVSGDRLELWLGEVKFYTSIASAIREVAQEISDHCTEQYLRNEFALIANKIDDTWPHADRLRTLLDRNTSLDNVFDALTIPVFLAFESPTVREHDNVSEAFRQALETELRAHHASFSDKPLPSAAHVHLFLFPMKVKAALVEAFDERLKACQLIGT